jgi:hypothetical protein
MTYIFKPNVLGEFGVQPTLVQEIGAQQTTKPQLEGALLNCPCGKKERPTVIERSDRFYTVSARDADKLSVFGRTTWTKADDLVFFLKCTGCGAETPIGEFGIELEWM